jgi:6-phosphogluconolactonase
MGESGDLQMKRPEKREVLIFQKIDELYDFLIKKWKEISEKAIEERGIFAVVLSGGETPVEFYQRLADSKDLLIWDKTHIFLTDERFVPFDHPDSNYGMIRRDLLQTIPIPQQNIHSILIYQSPEISAEKYEKDLKSLFNLKKGEFPEFDLILLSIGEEGHTASLFPSDLTLFETNRIAVAVHLDISRHDRITLTLPVINRARNIIFLVLGESKAEITREILENPQSSLPASRVQPDNGRLFFLLDKAASLLLSEKNSTPKK